MRNLLKVGIVILLFPLVSTSAMALVDPTRPPGFSESQPEARKAETVDLTAIYIYPSYRMAVIGGQIVMVGDKIGQFTITEINPYTVKLMGPGNDEQVLRLITPVKEQR